MQMIMKFGEQQETGMSLEAEHIPAQSPKTHASLQLKPGETYTDNIIMLSTLINTKKYNYQFEIKLIMIRNKIFEMLNIQPSFL